MEENSDRWLYDKNVKQQLKKRCGNLFITDNLSNMDSDSFKSVIVCGQCGEWFGDMLSQVHHLTTHSFTKTPDSTARTKSVLDFLQRCDGDTPDQSKYADANSSPGYSSDRWNPSADDALYDEKNETEANEYRDRLDIDGECGKSLGWNSHLHQPPSEGECDQSAVEYETYDTAGMDDLRACLIRDGDLNSGHLGHTDQNCEYPSGSELEVPENSRVLFSGTDEESQDGVFKLPDLEHEVNESPTKFVSSHEHQYKASGFHMKLMSPEVENRNESTDGLRSKKYDGYDYIFDENLENTDTPVNDMSDPNFYQSNRVENPRMGQMFNTKCQDGVKVYLNTLLDKRKYSSEGSNNTMGGIDCRGSLWDGTFQTDQTLSSSQQVAVRSDSPWRHPDSDIEDCLGVRGLNSAAKRQELSGEVPPGNACGSRMLPCDQNFLVNKQTRGFKRISDITQRTMDVKPEVTNICNLGQSLTVDVSTCPGARPMPKCHFETDMNHNTRSVPKHFVQSRNQYYVHGRSRPRKYENGDWKSDNLSFMLKKNPDSQGYSIYKPQMIEDGHKGEPLAINRQCSDNTNEVIDCNKKSHNSDSPLFDEKQNDYLCNSLPVEQHSQERPRSGESCRKMPLNSRVSDQKCSICGQVFEVDGDLEKHLISHKQQCHFCGESFEELEHLNAHLGKHLKDADAGDGNEDIHGDLFHLSCNADDPDFSINRQMNPVNGQQKKNYRCEICSKCFVAKHTLRIHMNIHLGKRSACPVCKQTFSTDWSVKRHIEKCHHKVKVSEKSFSSPNSLTIQKPKKDFVNEEGKSLFTCEVCEREFSSMKSLSNHSRTHQNRSEELHQYVRTFRCRECDHVYSRPDSLMAHMKVHGDKYRHSCAVCFAGFPTVTELDAHMQQHTAEDKLLNTCTFCGIGFDRHTSLVQHIQNCSKAPHGRVLEDFKLFERDQEKRSDDRRFQCSVCSKMYPSKKSLRHHMKVKGHIAPSD
ncbi:uncharacterized protein [Haliotis asinina]|uniref:uncharacterized protein n=1 Tax=Haliotis asinina TaxID=109174 RepID=UPI0035319FEC